MFCLSDLALALASVVLLTGEEAMLLFVLISFSLRVNCNAGSRLVESYSAGGDGAL